MTGSGQIDAELPAAALAGRAGSRRRSAIPFLSLGRLAYVFCLVTCVLNLSAQESSTTGSLHGTVINSQTRQPIAHALVTVQQYGQGTLTDNEGRFAFDGIPAGNAMMLVKRPGFGESDGGASSGKRVTVIVTAGSSADVTLELTPRSSIVGELVLPGDDSPDAMRVTLLRQQLRNGRSAWQPYRNATANSEGHFRFGDLGPGSYLVQVASSMDPAPADTRRLRYGYAAVFYPNAREFAGAGVIALAPGQEADVRLSLNREPFYPVALPVNNFEETRGVTFQVTSGSFLGLPARFSASDGMVHLDLPSGHYTLQARGEGPSAMTGLREFDVNPKQQPGTDGTAGTILGPSITLVPGNGIPVSVHSDQAPNGDAGSQTAGQQITLDLQPEAGASRNRGAHLQDVPGSASTGLSYLANVSPGRYWVNARAYTGYISSITSGGDDLLTAPLAVGADGSASPIVVSIRHDLGTVTATLASSLQTAAAAQAVRPTIFLYLLPVSGAAAEQVVPFEADGTASASNMAPGSYLAIASATRQEIEYRSSRVLAAFATAGQAFTLESGGATHVTINALVDQLNQPGAPSGTL